MQHDLIDEYHLYVHPILIGRGKPLFQASDAKINLGLAEIRTFGNGVVLLRYATHRGPGTRGLDPKRSLGRQQSHDHLQVRASIHNDMHSSSIAGALGCERSR